VTMIVGIVGTDGIILAADQKAGFATEGARTSSLQRKIFWDASREIACAASGNDGVGQNIAGELVETTMIPRDADEGDINLLIPAALQRHVVDSD
jgi:20S proteasome alpha/beta subunit